jgi:DNA modification methylase
VEPRLSDPDLILYNGDALAVLRELPAESVDCCVTSPPYYGLRDYGIEGQVGLEATPGEYVVRMVKIFREVRRVLTPHGTVWLNLGDSYVEKQLLGTPWRIAFALQDEDWWLRSDCIWNKPNAMPSSVRDRPTTSHEYVFLLSKQARYYFDRHAVLEPAAWERWGKQTVPKYEGTETATGWIKPRSKEALVNNGATAGGKNIRSVWSIPTNPYPEAHFATFPEELPRRCILAGCPEWVCRTCGQPRERIVETEPAPEEEKNKPHSYDWHETTSDLGGQKMQDWRDSHPPKTIGWTDCGHDDYRAGVVLDPFAGAGTTALVARSLERHSLLIELSAEYCDLIATRLRQLSLLT